MWTNNTITYWDSGRKIALFRNELFTKCSTLQFLFGIHKYQTNTSSNDYTDGLVHYCSNYSVLAMELLQSYTKQSVYDWKMNKGRMVDK